MRSYNIFFVACLVLAIVSTQSCRKKKSSNRDRVENSDTIMYVIKTHLQSRAIGLVTSEMTENDTIYASGDIDAYFDGYFEYAFKMKIFQDVYKSTGKAWYPVNFTVFTENSLDVKSLLEQREIDSIEIRVNEIFTMMNFNLNDEN